MLRNLLLISCLAFGLNAHAQNDVETLKVSGKQHYQGENLVRLKRLANQQLNAMGMDASEFELVGVTMEAKSRAGKGKATLIVGQDSSTKKVGRVSGNKLIWQATAPWTYKTVSWDLSGVEGQSNERWQVRFKGNIKVRSIHLHVASATTRVRIPMGGELMTQSSVLRLKRLLRDQGYNVKNAKLRKVTLVAKSKAGKAKSELHIGQKVKPSKTIGQAKAGLGFQSNRPRSYNRISWRAAGQTPGKWQIHMRGRIKVKAIIVEFKN